MKKRYIYTLSFLLPLLTLLCGMVMFGVAPFGDNSLLIIDGLHQYIPFFSILYDKLRGGESLFYTFRTGLGINFLALFSYYLSSPFNLVIALFPREQLNAVVSCLIVLKLSLSGLAASVYFARRSKNPDWHVVGVSVAYALNGYMVGYSWNVMWLDAIMILPIILLGIEKLIDERDGRIYCLALFYALYCNYYIGFMICIFSVIWYVFHPFRSIKQFFTRGFVFAGYSFLAAGMSAILLIPAFLGIKATSSGSEMGLPVHAWLTDFWSLITRQFDLAYPITHDNFDGNANLYFGIFTVIFAILYLLNKKISLLNKIKHVILIVFFYMSFNEEILNFIWHGFHNQYGIPNRFSFLYGFILLVMTFDVLENVEEIRALEPILALLGAGGLFIACLGHTGDTISFEIMAASGALILCYVLFLLLHQIDDSINRRRFHKNAVYAIMIGEILFTSLLGFDSNGQISIPKFFSDSKEMVKAIRDQEDGTFYRSEVAKSLMVDESTYYPMNAISLFGSTARDTMVDFMDSLGFNTGCNEYLYQGGTPLTNLMFDVKHLYYRKEDHLYTEFEPVGEENTKGIRTYRNPIEGMSIGYAIDPQIDEWYYQSDYPFRVLEDFCLQGYDIGEVYNNIPVNDPVVSGCTVSRTNDGEYFFQYQQKQSDNLLFSITLPDSTANLMLFYDGTQVDMVEISLDGLIRETGDLDGRVIPLGPVKKGTVVNVKMSLKGESPSGYIRLSAANFNQKQFDKIIKTMTSQDFKIQEMSDHHIKGSIDMDQEKYLFFSIPYDDGWNVKVDGKNVETATIGDALLSVIIPEGEHMVELDYVPEGFNIGAMLSTLSIFLFLILCVRIHFSRKESAEWNSEEESEQEYWDEWIFDEEDSDEKDFYGEGSEKSNSEEDCEQGYSADWDFVKEFCNRSDAALREYIEKYLKKEDLIKAVQNQEVTEDVESTEETTDSDEYPGNDDDSRDSFDGK